MEEIIVRHLKEIADKTYQQFHAGLCPGVDNIIGVRIPILRNYAKELSKQYSLEELLNQIGNTYYEEIMLQGMLIGLSKGSIEEILPKIESFIPKINNWAVCDIFCGGLKITKKYPEEMWNFLQKYLASEKEFEVRFGVVMLLSYYIDEEHLEKDFAWWNQINFDAYYVQMAVAWAVSIALVKFYDETILYLKHKDCQLDDFTYNKAIQKAIESYRITSEQKIYLRSLKRKK